MTNYPNNYDDSTSLPPADGYDAASINANIGATEAIEFELGLVPSGPYASVRTRLDILEARINNPFAPAPDVLNPFYIGNTGVSIQAGVGNPAVLAVPAVNGSLFLREDGSSFNQVYSYQGGFWTIVGATTGGLAGGDLTGAFPDPKVIGLDGYALSLTSTPTTGQVLTWNGTHWTAGTPGSGTFSAGGDLSGTSISQIVIGIQGNPVSATTPTAGQYLIENASATGSAWTSISGDISSSVSTPGALTVNSVQGVTISGTPATNYTLLATSPTAASWQPISSSVTLAGDVTGPANSNTVIQINGASVPASGALIIGNQLIVSGVSTLSYGPLNLAGGTNYVSGLLPNTNQSPQTISGAVGGTTAASTIFLTSNSFITGLLSNTNQQAQNLTLIGDVTSSSGTTTSATTVVVALQGNAIETGTNTASKDGYVLTWVNGASEYQVLPPSSSTSIIMSGDVTGTTSANTVVSISGSSPIPITPAQLQWTSTTVTPMLCQAITTLGTGQNLTVQAQNATGFNGGNLILSSGTGNNVGNVQLQAGGTTIAKIDSSKLYALKGFSQNVRTIVSSSLVLLSDNIIAVGTIVAPITVTLPASPSAGDTYFIKDSTGISLTYNITVNGNGNTIDGFANYIIAQSYACLALVFGNNSWMVV